MILVQGLMDNIELHSDIISKIIIMIIMLIFILCLILKVNYFNVFKIIRKYIGLFKERNNKFNKGAISLAFIVPFLMALVVLLSKFDETCENQNGQDGVILVITILTAMFFTILGFILEINTKIESSNKSASEKIKLKRLSDSIFYANMFEILMCIFILIFSFIISFTDDSTKIISFLIYWIAFTVIINMLMLLKRLYIVINELIKKE